MGAVKSAESRQSDSAMSVDVSVRTLVHPLHQVLLIEQWVVGTQCAGRITEALVVVAELSFATRWQEFIHMDHITK